MHVLEVKNLVKDYGKFRAVDHISFTVPKGKVIGLLGPNGAGKTTTIQILLGITLPSSGHIEYFGRDFFKYREECLQRLNFASAFNTLLGRITVWENLIVYAGLYNVANKKKKILDLCERLEATDLLHKRYWDLSAGQRTRINLIKSLINDPDLVLFDEPTASLDPDIADKVMEFIEEMKKGEKIAVLYTSHDMDEVTRICDEVIFLSEGKIVAHDTPLGLTKRIPFSHLQLTFDAPKEDVARYLAKAKVEHGFITKNIVRIKLKEEKIPQVIFDLGKEKVWITDIEVDKPSLEDVFLQIARSNP